MTGAEKDARPLKRSVNIAGHATSVSLEVAFWDGLKELAQARNLSIPQLIGEIDRTRRKASLSGALRIAVLEHYRMQTDGKPDAPSS